MKKPHPSTKNTSMKKAERVLEIVLYLIELENINTHLLKDSLPLPPTESWLD